MKKAFIAVLVGLGLILSTARDVSASHVTYTAEDPNNQLSGIQGTENYVFKWWAILSIALKWRADSEIHASVKTAITNWTTAIPSPYWVDITESPDFGVEVDFRAQTCPSPVPLAGCAIFDGFDFDPDRNASYWTHNTVYIDRNLSPDVNRTIAHEIGHIYGLEEQYNGDTGGATSCNTRDTIMNAARCDSLRGPTSFDISNVNAYWKQGLLPNMKAVANGSVGTYTWNDAAWAEYYQQILWYYWNGTQWINYASLNGIANSGVHQKTENRTISQQVDRRIFNAPAGTHIACGRPYFIQADVYGSSVCSNQVTLN